MLLVLYVDIFWTFVLQGFGSGQAEKHCKSVHLLEDGGGDYVWRKVTLEARMEQLFADD